METAGPRQERHAFIRKQLAIKRYQEAWLKKKVRETGESESHWVRYALDLLMNDEGIKARA